MAAPKRVRAAQRYNLLVIEALSWNIRAQVSEQHMHMLPWHALAAVEPQKALEACQHICGTVKVHE